jgi:3-oxoacyl-[acyl-carrier protein] reductase
MPEASRTALITGSGKNIGRACALALAKAGCNVVVNGARDIAAAENVAGEVRALGAKALVAMGDVGKHEDAMGIAESALKTFGTIDVLVNSAAVRRGHKFLEMTEQTWRRAMAVNFDAAYWLSRACLPGMLEKRWGRIVNFAGMHAITGHNHWAHVSASKHAVWGLTKSLAKEFGPAGITVNIVSPGPIKGEAHDSEHIALITPMKARVPAGRFGTPDDIAAVVGFLASPAAEYVNGQLIQINGGAET